MNDSLVTSMGLSFNTILGQTAGQIAIYLPRILASLAIFLIGLALAKTLRKLIVKILETFRISRLVQNTPVEHFLKNTDTGHKIEEVVGSIFYWLLMLIVLQTAVSVLGLNTITFVLDKLLGYLPHVFSAVIIIVFGVLLAGLVESVVKGSIRSIDGKAARLMGKISSYLVVSLSVMAAISELGIASEFMMILFVGFVGMTTLGCGLAIGLGGQDLVKRMLNDWYSQFKKEVEE